jgi:hypothetical protein
MNGTAIGTEIRLRLRDEETLDLEVPDGQGGHTRVPIEPAKVRQMFDGLSDELPRIYAQIEGPLPGEMTAEIPYRTPITALSNRVPSEVREALDEAATRARGVPPVLLLAERDPFPWELVRPRPDSRMLGQMFDVARFDGACAGAAIDVAGILVIAPVPLRPDLCEVLQGTFKDQHDEVTKHFPEGQRQLLDCVTATRVESLNQMRNDARRVVHYMGHHFHNDVDPGQSVLQLAGGDGLSPLDVEQEFGGAPVEAKWPWVFLNCCRGLAPQLGNPFEHGRPQWGTALRHGGAYATVGPYWRVEKSESFFPARQFSQFVLEEGSTLGAALRRIRAQPRPPTMLAYTMVGDPTTTVRVA